MVEQEILNRKGARKAQDIPVKVLQLLHLGKIETVNLTEWLAIDHVKLVQANAEGLGLSKKVVQTVLAELHKLEKPSTMNSVKATGKTIYHQLKGSKGFSAIFEKLKNHPSDSIRCYAPYLISFDDTLGIEEKLDRAKPLVADTHFGVREVVWMALRPELEKELEQSIELLRRWTKETDENLRRFTTEATRPRGVWCRPIEKLKANPEMALPLLEPLKSDPSKYVRDSVGNWLNDASKSQPGFVVGLCEKWQKESPTQATLQIIKKARRTIDK